MYKKSYTLTGVKKLDFFHLFSELAIKKYNNNRQDIYPFDSSYSFAFISVVLEFSK